MYSVNQHWDCLKVCVIGKSYEPEFYSFIKNKKLRNLFEKIAYETNEDLDNLEKLIKSFDVTTIRPNVPNNNALQSFSSGERIPSPISMIPRDQMIMIGETFFLFPFNRIVKKTSNLNSNFSEETTFYARQTENFHNWWMPILDDVQKQNNKVVKNEIDHLLNYVRANGITRCGKDLYFGINHDKILKVGLKKLAKKYFTNYRCHFVATHGHLDGCFKPVVPGLIISITDPDDNVPYKTEFPGWEVVYLPDESWTKTADWSKLKEKNGGKWWIQGYENDDEVIEFVETWLRDWVGYVEESVFDVNMLMIDKKNVICNGYNKIAFQAFERYGITPHICNLRHRYFWDGGIHCSTLDLHREGVKEDYFPERGTSSIIS